MFWGLIMEPNKRYTQVVEKPFHLSMASLDAATASVNLVQVMICYDNRNYLLCTLQKGSIWQVPLDLNFQEGTKISFTCNGDGHVHLTGYLIPEDELDEFDDLEDEEEDEMPQLVDVKKRKAGKDKTEQKPAKKSKIEFDLEDDDGSDDEEADLDDDDDDDDDDDEDLDINEDDDDDDEEDESDDEEDDEDEEEEEKEETPVKLSKKQKQNLKQKQNQQNQSQNKNEKNKLVNGKEKKPEKEQGKQKNKDDSKVNDKSGQQQPQKKKTIEGGIQIEDIKEGNGAPAKPGKFVSVYYVGRLKNGKKFDQTMQGEGFKFRLGKGEVIKGWDIGISGMKIGGKRRITIPPNMGYGAKGSPPVIPPNSTLNFEVELKAVH